MKIELMAIVRRRSAAARGRGPWQPHRTLDGRRSWSAIPRQPTPWGGPSALRGHGPLLRSSCHDPWESGGEGMEVGWGPIPFDRALIEKYDRPGPRYTSYPTAPHFEDDFGPGEHARLLAASHARGLPLSLYVHVPFCDTRCLFCGCHVQIGRDRERA